MTSQQIAPPTPRTPLAPLSAPAWTLYVYDNIAYLTFSGRVIATASVATPTRRARIAALFQRLTDQAGRA